MTIQRKKNFLVAWMCLFALLMFGLAVIAGIKNYSPIPFWDMWNGVYGFIIGLQDGNYSLWWSQHNEHRIVLARLFFWIDYKFFGLNSAFLIVCNYIFVVLAGWVFSSFIGALSKERGGESNTSLVLRLFIFGWLMLWTQKENLTWAFQSQFFLGQLIPLAMFYFLAVSVSRNSDEHFFRGLPLGYPVCRNYGQWCCGFTTCLRDELFSSIHAG